jgi:hypothetical protein
VTLKHTITFLAVLALTACGGGGSTQAPEATHVQAPAKVANVLLVGGNELFTITPNLAGGLTYTPRDFWACSRQGSLMPGRPRSTLWPMRLS